MKTKKKCGINSEEYEEVMFRNCESIKKNFGKIWKFVKNFTEYSGMFSTN